jgi:hypothetical protein
MSRAARFALLALILSPAAGLRAGTLTATITFPPNGAINADLTQPIQWTSVDGAQTYYLYVGTTAGANDLVNTGETLQTAYQAWNLPLGQTLYARMWTKAAGAWRYVDTTFTAGATRTPAATLVYPVNGEPAADPAQAFRWTKIPNAQSYYLYVGTSIGAKDLVNTGEIQATSFPAPALPMQQLLYARLWTRVAGAWHYVDSTFTEAPLLPAFTYPLPHADTIDQSRAWTWTAVPDVQAYYLYVGTTVGAKDLVNTGEIHSTSYLPHNLPQDRLLYARLWAKVANVWRYGDTTFSVVPLAAVLTQPANGAVNADSTLPFQWTAVAAAQSYRLAVGTSPGSSNLVNTGQIQGTSYLASSLPLGQTLYARLYTLVTDGWRYTDSSFTLSPLAPTLTYPVPGATSIDPARAWLWTAVPSAQSYYLYVGSTPGAKDIVNTGEIHQTSYVPQNLPLDRILYARVWAKVANAWHYTDATFTAAPLTTTITQPADGEANGDSTQPIRWTAVSAAQAYHLWIGTTAGAGNLLDTGDVLSTSYAATGLPLGQRVYARIGVEVGGIWRYADSSFTLSPLTATLTYPVNGAANVDSWAPAAWTAVPSAQAYYLYLGTTKGAKDLVDSYELHGQTSFSIASLPSGQTIYARLWTKVANVWRYVDTTFTVAPMKATWVYPRDKQHGVDVSQPFTWSPAPYAPTYRLYVSTSPSLADIVFDSGPTAQTSVTVPNLPLDRPLYARVLTNVHGTWMFNDAVFTAQATSAPASLIAPADGSMGVAADRPFRWSSVPMAESYRLRVGTSPGAADVYDSGETPATARFVPGLPLGVPLYASIDTRLSGVWHTSSIAFSAASYDPLSTAKRALALEWTAAVQGMASTGSYADIGTPLARETMAVRRAFPLCSQYASTLVRLLTDAGAGDIVRTLNIAFDSNTVDGHTLVEFLDPSIGYWMLLDPLFATTPRRAVDGTYAAAEDLRAAIHANAPADIQYEELTARTRAAFNNYYIDYPLLFLNLYRKTDAFVIGAGTSPLPYLTMVPSPVVAAPATYAVQCTAQGSTVTVTVDGKATAMTCNGIDRLAVAFKASNVEIPASAPPGTLLFRLPRYLF